MDAQAKYPDSSLADLYDELTMPQELLKAHKEKDNAVLNAYNCVLREKRFCREQFKETLELYPSDKNCQYAARYFLTAAKILRHNNN